METEVNIGRNNAAGLLLYYNEKAYAGIVSDGKTFTVYQNAECKQTLPNSIGRTFHIRLHNRGNRVTMQVSKDGEQWQTLAKNVDVSTMHHNTYGGFYALRPALVSLKKGSTVFRRFRYANTVPQEKDMGGKLTDWQRTGEEMRNDFND